LICYITSHIEQHIPNIPSEIKIQTPGIYPKESIQQKSLLLTLSFEGMHRESKVHTYTGSHVKNNFKWSTEG